MKFDGKPYVRVYQAIYEEQKDVKNAIKRKEYPHAKFKDIYQDIEGNIIIYPDGGKVKNKLYFGIGDFRNQIKYMYTYHHEQGAENRYQNTHCTLQNRVRHCERCETGSKKQRRWYFQRL